MNRASRLWKNIKTVAASNLHSRENKSHWRDIRRDDLIPLEIVSACLVKVSTDYEHLYLISE